MCIVGGCLPWGLAQIGKPMSPLRHQSLAKPQSAEMSAKNTGGIFWLGAEKLPLVQGIALKRNPD
jgi:hypothetical protein